jgi:hypothetical protein
LGLGQDVMVKQVVQIIFYLFYSYSHCVTVSLPAYKDVTVKLRKMI